MKKERAVKEIYDSIQGEWEDHCGPTASSNTIELPNNLDNNILQWVDDQKLDESISNDNDEYINQN